VIGLGGRSGVAVAGWLFADLLLGLAMLFFASSSVGEVLATATPSPTPAAPTATAEPSPPDPQGRGPAPTATPPCTGLEPTPWEWRAVFDGAALLGSGEAKLREEQRLREEVRAAAAPLSEADRKAGMMLGFGDTLRTDLARGRRLAAAVMEVMQQELPGVFGSAQLRPLLNIVDALRPGQDVVELEAYLLSPGCVMAGA
jgi:hypothetical protein